MFIVTFNRRWIRASSISKMWYSEEYDYPNHKYLIYVSCPGENAELVGKCDTEIEARNVLDELRYICGGPIDSEVITFDKLRGKE